MAAIISGQSDILRRGRFAKAIRMMADKHKVRVKALLEEIGDSTVTKLREITPKDTGAAAGTSVGAKRSLANVPWHPAVKRGLDIGNQPGQSGWQMKWINTANKFSIFTPMWDPYLKYVNYTMGNFVEEAARDMQQKLRDMR